MKTTRRFSTGIGSWSRVTRSSVQRCQTFSSQKYGQYRKVISRSLYSATDALLRTLGGNGNRPDVRRRTVPVRSDGIEPHLVDLHSGRGDKGGNREDGRNEERVGFPGGAVLGQFQLLRRLAS